MSIPKQLQKFEYQGTIESVAFGGQGILRHDGYVIFVPFTAPGDHVTVKLIRKKKQYGIGELITVNHPSEQRTTPLCRFFGQCGGCQLQHITYTAQLEIKRTFIQDALQRIARIPFNIPPITPAEHPWNYRRHVRLNVRENVAGYIAVDHHTLLPVDQCPIFVQPQESILMQLQQFLEHCEQTDFGEASLRILKQENHQFLLVFTFDSKIPPRAEERAQQALSTYPTWKGIILHSPTCTRSFGNTDCFTDVLGLSMSFSPFGFIQNYPEQSEKLYLAILNALPSTTTKVLDLFCGMGTTSLLIAQKGIEVIGIEIHQDTVERAQQNAQRNGLHNVRFISGKAEELTREIIGTLQPECVLCNPPRVGLDPHLIHELLEARPKSILYVSCMPATLARDVRFFIDAGYHLEMVQGFDMFPHTTHVETLIKLSLHPHQS